LQIFTVQRGRLLLVDRKNDTYSRRHARPEIIEHTHTVTLFIGLARPTNQELVLSVTYGPIPTCQPRSSSAGAIPRRRRNLASLQA